MFSFPQTESFPFIFDNLFPIESVSSVKEPIPPKKPYEFYL